MRHDHVKYKELSLSFIGNDEKCTMDNNYNWMKLTEAYQGDQTSTTCSSFRSDSDGFVIVFIIFVRY